MIEVVLSKSAEKDFSRLPKKEMKKAVRKLEFLEKSSEGKPLVGKLKSLWSLRAWPYRIIYEIEKSRIVVHRIIHRKEVYPSTRPAAAGRCGAKHTPGRGSHGF
ncbi:MAG: type II toxin-antitoxin system RelE/ParE family toxin [Patescibacteria group bacterium]